MSVCLASLSDTSLQRALLTVKTVPVATAGQTLPAKDRGPGRWRLTSARTSVLCFLGLCCWEGNRQTIGLGPCGTAAGSGGARPTGQRCLGWDLGSHRPGTRHIPERWTGMPASQAVGTCHETGAVTRCATPDPEQTPANSHRRGLLGGRAGETGRRPGHTIRSDEVLRLGLLVARGPAGGQASLRQGPGRALLLWGSALHRHGAQGEGEVGAEGQSQGTHRHPSVSAPEN